MNITKKLLFTLLFLISSNLGLKNLIAMEGYASGSSYSSDEEEYSEEENDSKGKIILLLGTSCSGKTTIGKQLVEKLENTVYISADEITEKEISKYENSINGCYDNNDDFLEGYVNDMYSINQIEFEQEDEQKEIKRLETDQILMIQKTKQAADNGKNVICDVVPVNSEEENVTQDIIKCFKYYKIYKILIYAPYKQIFQRAKEREDKRDPYSVIKQFATLYQKADPSSKKTKCKKIIKEKLHSPEIKRKCLTSSTNSYLNKRLWENISKNFFDNSKEEKTINHITPFDDYDHIFINRNDKKRDSQTVGLLTILENWLTQSSD